MTDEEAKHFIKVLCEYIDEREKKEKEYDKGRSNPIRGYPLEYRH